MSISISQLSCTYCDIPNKSNDFIYSSQRNVESPPSKIYSAYEYLKNSLKIPDKTVVATGVVFNSLKTVALFAATVAKVISVAKHFLKAAVGFAFASSGLYVYRAGKSFYKLIIEPDTLGYKIKHACSVIVKLGNALKEVLAGLKTLVQLNLLAAKPLSWISPLAYIALPISALSVGITIYRVVCLHRMKSTVRRIYHSTNSNSEKGHSTINQNFENAFDQLILKQEKLGKTFKLKDKEYFYHKLAQIRQKMSDEKDNPQVYVEAKDFLRQLTSRSNKLLTLTYLRLAADVINLIGTAILLLSPLAFPICMPLAWAILGFGGLVSLVRGAYYLRYVRSDPLDPPVPLTWWENLFFKVYNPVEKIAKSLYGRVQVLVASSFS